MGNPHSPWHQDKKIKQNPMDKIIKDDCKKILHQINTKKIKGKKILITGANGFLGQYIAATLSLANQEMNLGCTIDVVDLKTPKQIISSLLKKHKNIYYHQIDLTKPFNLEGYDYIFHSAGYGQPAKFVPDYCGTIKINVDATQSLLDTSPRATFVFFSSAEIYGNTPPQLIPIKENFNGNCPLHLPRSVYAESKRLGESLCAAYKRDKGMNIKIIRLSAVYGPGLPLDDERVMSEFIKKALVEKNIKLLDNGKSIKTYGYIADSVAMIIFIALYGKDFVYNVGGKDSVSILELAKKIALKCNADYKIPSNVSKLIYVGKDPKIVKLDLGKIKKEMKKLKFTLFSKGLENTIEWQKNLYKS